MDNNRNIGTTGTTLVWVNYTMDTSVEKATYSKLIGTTLTFSVMIWTNGLEMPIHILITLWLPWIMSHMYLLLTFLNTHRLANVTDYATCTTTSCQVTYNWTAGIIGEMLLIITMSLRTGHGMAPIP